MQLINRCNVAFAEFAGSSPQEGGESNSGWTSPRWRARPPGGSALVLAGRPLGRRLGTGVPHGSHCRREAFSAWQQGTAKQGDRPLRQLLLDAIRYGDRPEVKARLFQVVDKALDRKHLQELVEGRALTHDAMDVTRVRVIRDARFRKSGSTGAGLPGGLMARTPRSWT